eukprot:scaffold8036_cov99-Skeletonema_marinoi.AAC.4
MERWIAGGHGVALTQAATAQGWVGWKRKSPQGIASDGTLGAGHDDFGMNGSGQWWIRCQVKGWDHGTIIIIKIIDIH